MLTPALTPGPTVTLPATAESLSPLLRVTEPLIPPATEDPLAIEIEPESLLEESNVDILMAELPETERVPESSLICEWPVLIVTDPAVSPLPATRETEPPVPVEDEPDTTETSPATPSVTVPVATSTAPLPTVLSAELILTAPDAPVWLAPPSRLRVPPTPWVARPPSTVTAPPLEDPTSPAPPCRRTEPPIELAD